MTIQIVVDVCSPLVSASRLSLPCRTNVVCKPARYRRRRTRREPRVQTRYQFRTELCESTVAKHRAAKSSLRLCAPPSQGSAPPTASIPYRSRAR
jgi:hypothetical protein